MLMHEDPQKTPAVSKYGFLKIFQPKTKQKLLQPNLRLLRLLRSNRADPAREV